MHIMNRRKCIATLGAAVAGGLVLPSMLSAADSVAEVSGTPSTPLRRNHKCLYNLELHRLAFLPRGKTEFTPEYNKTYVTQLAGSDVDAVMCCPMLYRSHMFPSEVDQWWKKYTRGQVTEKRRSYDYLMKYLYEGGDPLKDTLEECRKINVDFFISYRMNEWHYVHVKDFPTHNPFWREHPEYWLADTDKPAYGGPDNVRLHNWLIPEVREYYFSLLEEMANKYDIDGIEFDFQRCWRLFHDEDIETGLPLLTEFVRRVRNMLDDLGKKRGKYLKLCVRSLDTVARCRKYGIDIADWDRQGFLDMITVSSCFIHSTEVGIEDYLEKTPGSLIYGEICHITNSDTYMGKKGFRYTQIEQYRAAALNYFARGAHGINFFNTDYVYELRPALNPALVGITDVKFLQSQSKCYGIYSNSGPVATSLKARNSVRLPLIIGDDPSNTTMQCAVLRVETVEKCDAAVIEVRLNGTVLKEFDNPDTELFPSLIQGEARHFVFIEEPPARDELKFYAVPLALLHYGRNELELKRVEPEADTITFYTLQLALYAPNA